MPDPSTSATGGASSSGSSATKDGRDIRSVVLQILAAFGTGVGVLGFVVFFGGAILWVRFHQCGLPSSEAVAVIPKPVLLTTGAGFLVPTLLLSLGAVLLLIVINLFLKANLWRVDRKTEDDSRTLAERAAAARAQADRLRDASRRLGELRKEGAELGSGLTQEDHAKLLEAAKSQEKAIVDALEAEENATRLESKAQKKSAKEPPAHIDELGQRGQTT